MADGIDGLAFAYIAEPFAYIVFASADMPKTL